MEDWQRGDWFDSTSLPWINPSPNMRSLNAATALSGAVPAGIFRGTTRWAAARTRPSSRSARISSAGRELAAYLDKRLIPGVRVYPTSFTPTESNFKGVRIEGVRFVITNRELLDSTRLGLEVAAALEKLYPGKIDFAASKRLIGSDDVVQRLKAGEDPRQILQSFEDPLEAFLKVRERYLIYR